MNRIITFALVTGYLSFVSMAVIAQPSSAGTHSADSLRDNRPAPAILLNDLVLIEGERPAIRNQLAPKINAMIAAKDYAGLDKMAEEFRTSKAKIARGLWNLQAFYYDICFDWDCNMPNYPDDQLKERLAFLNSWAKAKPDSITARVALGRTYANYAWIARGGGYASTVTQDGWQLFEERLKTARDILISAKKLKTKCPVWWETMQRVALGEGWDRAEYEKLFNEAITFEPDYISYYRCKAMYLLPRWYGQDGDWQKFALDSANKVGGEEGDILYARIGWMMHEYHIYNNFMRDSGISWPKMKKGMLAIIKKYPDSQAPLNELAYLACRKDDKPCARNLFERMGKNMDREIWYDEKETFLSCHNWALSD